MCDLRSLQNLVNATATVQQKIEVCRSSVLFNAKSTDSAQSEYHNRFVSLMSKFSVFAEEYRFELEQFHKLVLNNMAFISEQQKLQKIERERQQILNKMEMISNSNTEIVENLNEIETNSVVSSSVRTKSPSPISPKPVSVSVPASTVTTSVNTTTKSAKNIRKIAAAKPKKTKTETNKTSQQKTEQKSAEPKREKQKPKPKSKPKMKDSPYVYSGSNWEFCGVAKSSTQIFIGNLPSHISVSQINHFVQRRCHISMDQIKQTKIFANRRGNNTKHCVLRFTNAVDIGKIRRFINKINAENDQIYRDMKAEKEKEKNSKKAKSSFANVSWKKRIFVKLNRTDRFYANESDMFNDESAKHTLFIRNFDILNEECHFDLTQALLEFGELFEDIYIDCDHFGDPFCVATFKYLNDAILCCNDNQIEFGKRILQIRYSRD